MPDPTKFTQIQVDETSTFTGVATFTAAPVLNAGYQIADDQLLKLGSSKIGMVNRSTALSANTALTGVIPGTPVVTATPADSLIIGNLVASGDILFVLNDGSGHGWEYERLDGSAKLHVFNEAGSDIDHRIEGDNNANLAVWDAGTDSVGFGGVVVAGAFLALTGNAVNRAGVTAVGRYTHIPAGTVTQTNSDPTTLAIAAVDYTGIVTFAGSNPNQTLNDLVTQYIAGAPAAGTNVTATRRYAQWIDADEARFDGGITIADRGTVTQATNKSTGVTLNNRSGAITMNNAALADAATVSFTVTNSTVGANDVVIAVHASAGTAGAYQVHANAMGAGSFAISVRNVSGGPLSEAIVINFVVIGGDV